MAGPSSRKALEFQSHNSSARFAAAIAESGAVLAAGRSGHATSKGVGVIW